MCQEGIYRKLFYKLRFAILPSMTDNKEHGEDFSLAEVLAKFTYEGHSYEVRLLSKEESIEEPLASYHLYTNGKRRSILIDEIHQESGMLLRSYNIWGILTDTTFSQEGTTMVGPKLSLLGNVIEEVLVNQKASENPLFAIWESNATDQNIDRFEQEKVYGSTGYLQRPESRVQVAGPFVRARMFYQGRSIRPVWSGFASVVAR